MQAKLLNFGDATRVVRDTLNRPLVIDIGQVVDADIHDAHFHMIKQAVRSDTLMVVPKEARITDKLKDIIALLKLIEQASYDEVLQRFNEVVPFDEERTVRPNRDTMRRALCDIARYEVAKALSITSQVRIHEQGDAITRQPVTKDDASDGVLNHVVEPPPTNVVKPRAPKRSKPPAPVVSTKVARERL